MMNLTVKLRILKSNGNFLMNWVNRMKRTTQLLLMLCTLLITLTSCGTVSENVSHTSLSEEITDITTINKSTSDVFQSSEGETTVTTSIETSQATSSTTVYETSSESTQVSICETTRLTMHESTQVTHEAANSTTSDATLTTTSQTVEYLPLEPLSEEAELKLREDFTEYKSKVWSNAKSEDMYVLYYYGTYNNCEVVVMYSIERQSTDDIKFVSVAGYELALPSGSFEILLHKDSTFIDINTAYDYGYLNDEDIAAIYHYANE